MLYFPTIISVLEVLAVTVPVLFTTIMIPISLISNWKSITKDVKSYVIIKLLLETLLLAVFLVLDILLFYIFFESILPPLFILIGIFGSDNRVKASFYLFLYTLLGSLFSLSVFSYHYLEIHTYGSNFGIYLKYCVSKLVGGIANYPFNDIYLATLFIIGISMIMISLMGSNKNMSIKDKLIYFIENFKQILPFMVCMFIFIIIINIFLFLCGLGVSISTLNLTLFFYTLFCKVALIKIVVTLVISAYTKEFKLNSFSLSVSSVMFIFILAGINFYYSIPLVKFILGLGLTNATNIFNKTAILIESTASKNTNSESLAKGLFTILTKFPCIGRFLESSVKGFNVHTMPFKGIVEDIKNVLEYYTSILEGILRIKVIYCDGPDGFKKAFAVLPFSDLNSEEISELYSLSDSTTPVEVNEDEVNEELLPFSDLSSQEIYELYNSSYSTSVSEINEEELLSSLSSEEISESLILASSSYTNNNTSSISEEHSPYWSNNPSSSGKNTIDKFEKTFYKKREVKGAFFTDRQFENYITPKFKSCRSIRELNRITQDSLDELKNITNRFKNENDEDAATTERIHNNAAAGINKQIQLNNQNITHLTYKLLISNDPDQKADLTNQKADLENQNISLSYILTTSSDARDDLMDHLNSWLDEEGETYARRSRLVNSLWKTHSDRISDYYDGFDWYADSKPEDSEEEDWETVYSETEGSEEDSNKGKDTENDKGKERAEDVSEDNASSTGIDQKEESNTLDLQFENDTQRAIRESINDSENTYNGESSKMGASSRK